MDIADLASKAETEARERALAKRQKKTGVSGYHCKLCGEPITELRRKAIITELCIDCARIEEKRKSHEFY